MIWSNSCKVFPTTCKVVTTGISFSRERKKILCSWLVVLIAASTAQAQTGDWQGVQDLQPGTRISVKARHRVRCIFQRATQNGLTCERTDRLFRTLSLEVVFDRRSIREVRLERSDEANGAVGAVIGAGAGAAVSASKGNGTVSREGGALLIGGIGAITGWFVGNDFHILHGRVVYKR